MSDTEVTHPAVLHEDTSARGAPLRMEDLTPRKIVVELDRYIIGQAAAKRSYRGPGLQAIDEQRSERHKYEREQPRPAPRKSKRRKRRSLYGAKRPK